MEAERRPPTRAKDVVRAAAVVGQGAVEALIHPHPSRRRFTGGRPLAGDDILHDVATAGRVVDEAEAERRTTPTLPDPAPTHLDITGSTAQISSSPSRRWILIPSCSSSTGAGRQRRWPRHRHPDSPPGSHGEKMKAVGEDDHQRWKKLRWLSSTPAPVKSAAAGPDHDLWPWNLPGVDPRRRRRGTVDLLWKKQQMRMTGVGGGAMAGAVCSWSTYRRP